MPQCTAGMAREQAPVPPSGTLPGLPQAPCPLAVGSPPPLTGAQGLLNSDDDELNSLQDLLQQSALAAASCKTTLLLKPASHMLAASLILY